MEGAASASMDRIAVSARGAEGAACTAAVTQRLGARGWIDLVEIIPAHFSLFSVLPLNNLLPVWNTHIRHLRHQTQISSTAQTRVVGEVYVAEVKQSIKLS